MVLTGETEVLGEKHYTAWVVDGWMSVEQWWNISDMRTLKYWDKTLSHCHCAHHSVFTYCLFLQLIHTIP